MTRRFPTGNSWEESGISFISNQNQFFAEVGFRPRLFAFYDCKGAVIGKGFLGFVGAGAWQEIGCRSDCEMQGGGYEKESVVKRIYGEQMRGIEPEEEQRSLNAFL